MYRILIVDDEKKEREGIALLIRRFGIQLKTELAANGEEALILLRKKHFDVLLTDIKMPYMDGIQLIRSVQELGQTPICIIYSAYGEFEYAQNAISLGVLEYLLKPIELEAFQELFKKVICLCDEKEKDTQKQAEIIQYQEEAIIQRLGWELLTYLDGEENKSYSELEQKIEDEWKNIFNPDLEFCIPVLIFSYSNLFVRAWDEYRQEIEEQFGRKTMIFNNTDNQIFMLLICEKDNFKLSRYKKQCEVLIDTTQKKYQSDLFVVLGKECESLSQLKKEYGELKDQMDYQFFIQKSRLLIHDESYFLRKENNMLGLYFERIFNCAKMQDYKGMVKEFQKVFHYLSDENGFSSIYVKYTFTDAIKRINEYTNADIDLIPYIEQIYHAKNIENVSISIGTCLAEMENHKKEEHNENRLVRMARDIVYDKYNENNLNVSFIADELSVSAAYLSNLFKVETGINLVKFITQYRMERAKELLVQTNMKIGDVAQKVGYLNVSYFTSIFRNQEGCSPIQYREKEGI